MRKLICSLLCIIFCLGLSFGCSKTNPNTQSKSESESVEKPKEEQKGSIYSLHALYAAGKLTQEDLLNIAYYSDNAKYNEELMGEDFVPTVDATLTPELENELKETIVNVYKNRKVYAYKLQVENIEIEYYCGYYEGYYLIEYDIGIGPFFPDGTIVFTEIGGVKFGFSASYYDPQIDGVNFDKDDGSVLEVSSENFAPPCIAYDSFSNLEEVKNSLQGTGQYKFLLPRFQNMMNVNVEDVNFKLRYNDWVIDYPEKKDLDHMLAFVVTASIEDLNLQKYVESSKLQIMMHIPKISIELNSKFICVKYKYIDKNFPQYNYVVVLYQKNDKGSSYVSAEIYYYAEQDIPIEYFEKLFTNDKFEWVQA